MKLEDILCCPECKADLAAPADAGRAGCGEADTALRVCAGCGARYPVVDGVADFLPDDRAPRKRSQKLMESERMVRIYEGKWWRSCRLFGWLMGIGLADEMALIQRIADPGPADTVLDLACGPGLYARAFAQGGTARRVVGLDLSWPMLRYAAAKARRLGIANVAFVHGDAHRLPLKDGALGAANCCGALHLFPDVRQVLAELHRAIRPGGRFAMALALRTRRPLNRLKARLDERFWGTHYFTEEELRARLHEAGFEPTIHHAQRIWMIACGVRRP